MTDVSRNALSILMAEHKRKAPWWSHLALRFHVWRRTR